MIQPTLKLSKLKSIAEYKQEKDKVETPFSKVKMAMNKSESSGGSSIDGDVSVKKESRKDLVFINSEVYTTDRPVYSRKSVIMVPPISLATLQEAENEAAETRKTESARVSLVNQLTSKFIEQASEIHSLHDVQEIITPRRLRSQFININFNQMQNQPKSWCKLTSSFTNLKLMIR